MRDSPNRNIERQQLESELVKAIRTRNGLKIMLKGEEAIGKETREYRKHYQEACAAVESLTRSLRLMGEQPTNVAEGNSTD